MRGGGVQKVDIKIVNIIIINFALLDKLKSKEPPQTFVPKILVAYICHFKGLHQPKPCQKPKKILKLIFFILFMVLLVGPMSLVKLT